MPATTLGPALIFIGRSVDPLNMQAIVEVYAASAIWRTLGLTILQASVSAGVTLVASLPGAYAIGRLSFPGKRLLRSLLLVPFVLPSIVVVIALIGFYGRSGLIGSITGSAFVNLYGFAGIIIAHTFYNISIPTRLVGEAWSRIPEEYREAARAEGATGGQYLRTITLPLLRNSMLGSFVLVFMLSFLSFGIVLVFGGIQFATLEVRLYQAFASLDTRRAALIAALQLLFSLGFILAAASRANEASSGEIGVTRISRLRRSSVLLLIAYGSVAFLFLAGPLLALVVRGAAGLAEIVGPSGRIRSVVGVGLTRIAGTSLAIALASGSLCFLTALLLAQGSRSKAIVAAAQAPIGISFVTISIGLKWIAPPSVPAIAIIIFAEALLSFPFVYRLLDTLVGDLDPVFAEVATTLGAGRTHIALNVYLPLLRRGLTGAFTFAVAIPFADFTGVLTLGRGRIVTFPVAIYRLLGFRNFDLALGVATLYVGLVFLILWTIDVGGETSLTRRPLPRRKRV